MSRQGTALFLVLLALPTAAMATEKLLDSQAPYWEAGARDQKLSQACSLGRFNERQMGRYIVRLHAKSGGAAVLGVAKGNGINLYDPDKLAVVTEDYMFRQDGTSACEVFVGGRKLIPPGATPPAKNSPATPPAPAPATPAPAAPAPAQPTVPGASPKNGPPT
jgi:hypothetical protein